MEKSIIDFPKDMHGITPTKGVKVLAGTNESIGTIDVCEMSNILNNQSGGILETSPVAEKNMVKVFGITRRLRCPGQENSRYLFRGNKIVVGKVKLNKTGNRIQFEPLEKNGGYEVFVSTKTNSIPIGDGEWHDISGFETNIKIEVEPTTCMVKDIFNGYSQSEFWGANPDPDPAYKMAAGPQMWLNRENESVIMSKHSVYLTLQYPVNEVFEFRKGLWHKIACKSCVCQADGMIYAVGTKKREKMLNGRIEKFFDTDATGCIYDEKKLFHLLPHVGDLYGIYKLRKRDLFQYDRETCHFTHLGRYRKEFTKISQDRLNIGFPYKKKERFNKYADFFGNMREYKGTGSKQYAFCTLYEIVKFHNLYIQLKKMVRKVNRSDS